MENFSGALRPLEEAKLVSERQTNSAFLSLACFLLVYFSVIIPARPKNYV